MNKTTTSALLRYPDFLCIGAQKAGTTWLHRALRRHPGIWLPPFKEIQYFNRAHPRRTLRSEAEQDRHDATRLDSILKLMQSKLSSGLPPEEKLAQVYCLSLIGRAERSDEWYGRIFQNASPDLVCGEISPDYAILPEEGVAHILRLNPEMKIIFIMRDPIDRGWSHLRMGESNGIAERIPHLDRVSGALFLAYSDYMTTIARFCRHVPTHNFQMLFFDDVLSRPRELLADVCRFLGVKTKRAEFGKVELPVNAGLKRTMEPELYARFREVFLPFYQRLLDLDHPITTAWYRRHYAS